MARDDDDFRLRPGRSGIVTVYLLADAALVACAAVPSALPDKSIRPSGEPAAIPLG
jgi:hypothetical protein